MGRRGFTLVEVLVSLVVLAVGLLALATLNVTYVRATALSHQGSQGALLAQDKMEQLRRCAVADRPGTFSVYGFPYLVSTAANYTSLEDPPGSGTNVAIAGLLAGATGAQTTTTGGTVYEVLHDDGSHGDAAAGDGIYTNTDTVYTATQSSYGYGGYTVNRVYSVQPITTTAHNQTSTDYAILRVDATWTEQQGSTATTHTYHLESLAYRRQ